MSSPARMKAIELKSQDLIRRTPIELSIFFDRCRSFVRNAHGVYGQSRWHRITGIERTFPSLFGQLERRIDERASEGKRINLP
jgi:hypothetical protein